MNAAAWARFNFLCVKVLIAIRNKIKREQTWRETRPLKSINRRNNVKFSSGKSRARKMFRRFSLFDASPPPAKISIRPPKTVRKSAINSAIINSLQASSAPILKPSQILLPLDKYDSQELRSRSLDHSRPASNAINIHPRTANQRYKSATLPPIIRRELPPASPTTRWYSRLGNSFRRIRRKNVNILIPPFCFKEKVKCFTIFYFKTMFVVILMFTAKCKSNCRHCAKKIIDYIAETRNGRFFVYKSDYYCQKTWKTLFAFIFR